MYKHSFLHLLLLLLFILSIEATKNSSQNLNVGGFAKDKRLSQNGFNFHPRLQEFKGFKRAIGYEISLSLHKKSESDNFNLFFTRPSLGADGSFKMSYIEAEYENRDYITEQMFTRCRIGLRSFQPESGFERFYQAKGQHLYDGWKPYISFGLGYRSDSIIPGFNIAPILSLDYIIGDDYRLPSDHPGGHHKIPAKGFRTGISLRF